MLDLDDRKTRTRAESSEINLRVLKAICEFASKDKDRRALNGVCVEFEERTTTYVATDGTRLVCLREETTQDNCLLGAFTIPTHHCKAFKLEKEDTGLTTIFAADEVRLTVVHGTVDLTFAPIDSDFPNWRKASPRSIPSGVLAQYGFKPLDSFRKLSEALELPSPFLAPNGDGPAFVWFAGTEQVFGLIMPYRTTDQMQRHAPSWATRGGPTRRQSDIEDDDILRQPPSEGETDGDEVSDARH